MFEKDNRVKRDSQLLLGSARETAKKTIQVFKNASPRDLGMFISGITIKSAAYFSDAEIITSHANNFGSPIIVFSGLKITSKDQIPAKVRVIVNGMGFGAGEVLQGMDIYPGTFDPKDFIAYGLGTSVAYGVEKFGDRIKQKSENSVSNQTLSE